MAWRTRISFGRQSVTTGVEYETNLDTPAISTSIKRSGSASLECSGSLGNGVRRGISHTFSSLSTGYYQVPIYIDSLDATVGVNAFIDMLSGSSKALSVNITNVLGVLVCVITYNAGGNTLTNTAVLSFDTWHVFEFYYNSADAGSNDDITVWLDGTQVGATTTASLTLAPAIVAVGIENNSGGTVSGTKVHFDHVAVNDTTGSVSNGRINQAHLTDIPVLSAGDNTEWQDDGSASQGTALVGNIDEITPDDSTTYNKRTTNTPATNPIDDWQIDDPTDYGIGTSDTIVAVGVGARVGATSNTASTRNVNYRIKSASGGTVNESTAVDISFNGWRTHIDTNVPNYQHIAYVDPTTSAAWTVTGTNSLTNAQIGIKAATSSTNEIRYSTLWALVEYIPASGTTTPQTITGKARITATVQRTITGLARITATTVRTIMGKARIRLTVPQTITGKSRITATTPRTVTGVARITATVLRTLTGVGRITVTVGRTVTGLAHIQITTPQTITGKSRVTTTTARVITGKARVTNTVTRTVDGKARVQQTTPRTVVGLARVTATATRTILGVARIVRTVAQTIDGKARISEATQRTIDGKARMEATVARTITGVANIIREANITPIGIILNDVAPDGALTSGSDLDMVLSGGPNGRILNDDTIGALDQTTAGTIENRVT